MKHHKKKLAFFIFLNLSVLLFSHNPVVRSFELNYSRKENGQLLQGSVSYKIGMNLEEQNIARNFLTWFMKDFGLQDAGYCVQQVEKTEEGFCSVYAEDCYDEVGSVKLFFNHQNECTSLCIYEYETLIAQTQFRGYENKKGFKYPTVIQTDFFDANEKVSSVEIVLSNVKLNQGITETSKENTIPVVCLPQKEIENQVEHVEPHPYKEYEVSTSSVLVHCAFDFYKKFITDQDIPGCAYTPTCSAYMLQAVSSYGVLGVIKGFDRLSRCTHSETKRNIYKRNENGLIVEND